MKTRIIKTGIYSHEILLACTPDVRAICVYLYTNSHIGLTDIYKLPPQVVQLETGYDISVIKLVLDNLQELGVIRHKDHLWIKLLREDFASLVYSGGKNEKAIEKYLNEIPLEIKTFLGNDTSIDSSMHTNYKSKIINHKSKIINKSPIGHPEIDGLEGVSSNDIPTTQEVLPADGGKKNIPFESFWVVYPVKKEKFKSSQKWEKLDNQTRQAIIAHVSDRKEKDRQWIQGYVPYPTTFLNGRLWQDEYEQEQGSVIINLDDK